MKRFRLFLTLLAFLGAGVGVFATAVTTEDAFATSYRIQVSTPCDTIVQDDNCVTSGSTTCKVRTGANQGKEIHLFDDQTMSCQSLFRP